MAARGKKVKKRASTTKREKRVRKPGPGSRKPARTRSNRLKSAKPKSRKLQSGKPKSGRPKSVAKTRSVTASLKSQLRAARDRQTASAEILRAIASSSGEAEGALQQIAETSARLFGAPSVTIRLVEGGEWGRTIRFGPSSRRIGAEVPAEQRRLAGRNLPG